MGVVSLGMLTGCSAARPSTAQVQIRTVGSPSGYHAAVLDHAYQVPPLAITTSTGQRRTLEQVLASPGIAVTLVTIGYTSCDDGVCDTVVADSAQALRDLEPHLRSRVQMVMISVDPQRDTTSRLARYMARFAPPREPDLAQRVFALRPDTDAGVSLIAQALGFSVENPAAAPTSPQASTAPAAWAAHGQGHGQGNGYEVTHSSQLVGVNAQGQGVLVWSPQTRTVTNLASDLRTYLEQH